MTFFLTPEGRKKIEQELEELRSVRRPQVADRIRAAKELGDLSENAEYTTAKEEQGWIENEIIRLENLLRNVEIIDSHQKNKEVVRIGSTVKLKIKDDFKTFMIVDSEESDPAQGRISYESPMGQALLNKRLNEKVEFQVPTGSTTFTIVEIK